MVLERAIGRRREGAGEDGERKRDGEVCGDMRREVEGGRDGKFKMWPFL